VQYDHFDIASCCLLNYNPVNSSNDPFIYHIYAKLTLICVQIAIVNVLKSKVTHVLSTGYLTLHRGD